MDLDISWHAPIDLQDDDDVILTCDLNELPEEPGVYAFCRMFGDKVIPLYIGQSTNLRGRIKGHFERSVKLMKKIKDAKNGQKVVLTGEWRPKRGQNKDKALAIIESALIKYALAEGHDLLNVAGARTSSAHHQLVGEPEGLGAPVPQDDHGGAVVGESSRIPGAAHHA
ncbi:MAG: GIY-YIG nuclease family protein [Byssovorax sp.]